MSKIFSTIDKIEPLYQWTYKIVMFICKILLIADICITSLAVAGRYIPFIPAPAWSEQMVLTFMIYMAVLSATLAIRTNAHIRMTALDSFLPPRVIQVLDIVSDIAVFALGYIMLTKGIEVCNSPLAKFGKYESIPTLSRVWMYLPIPIAGGSMMIFELESFYRHLKVLLGFEDTVAKEGK